MQRFARWFGSLFGLVLLLHGLSLAVLHYPLIAIRGTPTFFGVVTALLGETLAWLLYGYFWMGIGLLLIYRLNTSPKSAKDSLDTKKARRDERNRRRKSRQAAVLAESRKPPVD